MNYVPDFADWVWILGVLVGSAGTLYGIQFVDAEWKWCDRKTLWKHWIVTCIFSCMGLLVLGEHEKTSIKVSFMILGIYLIVSVVMDGILCKVNDVVQYIGLFGAVIYVLERNPFPSIGVSLLLFAGLQRFLFLRYYGEADGMAFLICALYFAGMGKEADCYFLHMTLCYIVLAVVQGIAGNVSLKGKLIKPVAMLPYICGSFFMVLLSCERI